MKERHKEYWAEFRRTGLLWWVNRSLHLFGWAITLAYDNEGQIISVFPQRVTYRGFSREDEETGFKEVHNYLDSNIEQLKKEIK